MRVPKEKEALMKHRTAIHLQISMFLCLDSHHAEGLRKGEAERVEEALL